MSGSKLKEFVTGRYRPLVVSGALLLLLVVTLAAYNLAVGGNAAHFRAVQLVGLAGSLGLLGSLARHVFRNLRREDLALARTRAEIERILDTVSEGLLLLDRRNTIGMLTSRSLRRMLGREDVAGLSLETLLADLVPEKTRRTALDYIALLWSERVNENLVRTINPLGEVEVRVPGPAGERLTRFLSFNFSRVRVGARTTQLLCTVADVTDRVLLARELAATETEQQHLLDLLLAVLQVEPDQLAAFLADAEAAMRLVNAVLKLPAREETAFREKLERIFREVHALKAEAAALGLRSVESRAHRFEDALAELRGRQALSGNDFLPLAVKLDDLFGHLGSVRDLVGRLGQLRAALIDPRARPATADAVRVGDDADAAAATGPDVATDPAIGGGAPQDTAYSAQSSSAEEGAPPADSAELAELAEPAEPAEPAPPADVAPVQASLQRLANRIAAEHGREVSLVCVGLESVPSEYAKAVRDVLNQLVRNAVVHGIEAPEERVRNGKSPVGTLAVEFADRGSRGIELTFQDDGRGLDRERIRATAVARGLISAEQAAVTDPKKLARFIFKPGFSTADATTTDAGRGVGMSVVRETVVELGGRISLSSRPGQFTRLRVFLPVLESAAA